SRPKRGCATHRAPGPNVTPLYNRHRSGALEPIPLDQRAAVRTPQPPATGTRTPPPAFTVTAVPVCVATAWPGNATGKPYWPRPLPAATSGVGGPAGGRSNKRLALVLSAVISDPRASGSASSL